MQELEPKEWDRLIQINLTGSYNVMRPTLERMRLKKGFSHSNKTERGKDPFRWEELGITHLSLE